MRAIKIYLILALLLAFTGVQAMAATCYRTEPGRGDLQVAGLGKGGALTLRWAERAPEVGQLKVSRPGRKQEPGADLICTQQAPFTCSFNDQTMSVIFHEDIAKLEVKGQLEVRKTDGGKGLDLTTDGKGSLWHYDLKQISDEACAKVFPDVSDIVVFPDGDDHGETHQSTPGSNIAH